MAKTNYFQKGTPRILSLVLIFIVFIGILYTINNYYSQLAIFENKQLSKLSSIASTLAITINGDMHERLSTRYPEYEAIKTNTQDKDYKEIHDILAEGMRVNQLTTTLYTMIYDSSQNVFCFMVSSSDHPYFRHKYLKFPKILTENYDKGGTIKPYMDENGYWLSSFAPIKNSHNKTVAILQVDESFSAFIMEARAGIFKNLLMSLLVLGVIGFSFYQIIKGYLQQEERVKEELQNIEKLRKELIANISHDLRTPLASIHGYVDLLLDKHDELDQDKRKKYLKITLENTVKMNNLVGEIFELSKIESDERKINPQPFVISELCNSLKVKYGLQAKKKNIEFKISVPETELKVMAEMQLIERVLDNLLSNALKYTNDGGTVELSVGKEKDKATIKVSDSGIGIAKAEIEHIFDRYYRGENMGNRKGTGLGLAIVKKILELHKSSPIVNSELGKGTSFLFTLQIA